MSCLHASSLLWEQVHQNTSPKLASYLFRAAFLHSHKPLKKCFLIQAQLKFAANIYHLEYKLEDIGYNGEQIFLFLEILLILFTLFLTGHYTNTHRLHRITVTNI